MLCWRHTRDTVAGFLLFFFVVAELRPLVRDTALNVSCRGQEAIVTFLAEGRVDRSVSCRGHEAIVMFLAEGERLL